MNIHDTYEQLIYLKLMFCSIINSGHTFKLQSLQRLNEIISS